LSRLSRICSAIASVRRAETLPADQLLLALEEVEQAEVEAIAEAEARSSAVRAQGERTRRANRGALPAHLPRIETTVDVESRSCPCCRGELQRIGEDVSEISISYPPSSGFLSCGGPNTPVAFNCSMATSELSLAATLQPSRVRAADLKYCVA
jgi:Transposase C of IS166 homeodomain